MVYRTDSLFNQLAEDLSRRMGYDGDGGGGGGGGSDKPDGAGWLMPPETFTYNASNVFTLKNTPKFATEVLVLKDDSFHYLKMSGDYGLVGKTLTIFNPTLAAGDSVKIVYAI